MREALSQTTNRLHRLVHTQRGLGQPDEVLGVGNVNPISFIGVVDEGGVLGSVPHGSLDLLVTGVADEEDVVVLTGESHRFTVNLRDERAGGIDCVQGAIFGLLDHHRRDTVSGEHNVRPRGPQRPHRQR